ncbi:MAG: MBL fold metallo-hydrolase [Thermodesulfovibrionales bacterium]
MRIQTVVVGQLEVNCFILWDEQSRDACVIDPGDEPELIIGRIEANWLRPLLAVCTHAHYDHVCATRDLRDRYGLRLAMHRDDLPTYRRTQALCLSWGYEPDDFREPDILLSDGDLLRVGEIRLQVIHTPGHSPGSICVSADGVLFSGDTLFRGTVGRTDLPGGDPNALLASLEKIARLPAGTKVLCGHDRGSVLGEEIARNPFFRQVRVSRGHGL